MGIIVKSMEFHKHFNYHLNIKRNDINMIIYINCHIINILIIRIITLKFIKIWALIIIRRFIVSK